MEDYKEGGTSGMKKVLFPIDACEENRSADFIEQKPLSPSDQLANMRDLLAKMKGMQSGSRICLF